MNGTYCFYHMRRSGGHAVIKWLLSGAGSCVWINDEIKAHLFLSGRTFPAENVLPYASWVQRKIEMHSKHPKIVDAIVSAKTILTSLEDWNIEIVPFKKSDIQKILLVRHPENIFSSRIIRWEQAKNDDIEYLKVYDLDDPKVRYRAIELWKTHARLALGLIENRDNVDIILYDSWVSSAGYREKLARHFELAGSVKLPDQIERQPGDSSFPEIDFSHSALMNRKANLSEAQRLVLLDIMKDPEMQELKALFEKRQHELEMNS